MDLKSARQIFGAEPDIAGALVAQLSEDGTVGVLSRALHEQDRVLVIFTRAMMLAVQAMQQPHPLVRQRHARQQDLLLCGL
eukprot:scaffold3767_cov114-Isochrysis_galbana.AAC.10